jgi:hypothetical protein
MAIVLTPNWMYLPMVNWTGEIKEYMKDAARNSGGQLQVQKSQTLWINGVKDYVRKWIEEHKEIKTDTWTSADRSQFDEN